MDNKIICPACKKEIVDIAEFRNTMTCPMCNTFLKNNKEFDTEFLSIGDGISISKIKK